MKNEDLQRIEQHPGRQAGGLTCELVLTGDPRSHDLEGFARKLAERWPALVVTTTRADADHPPYMDLGGGLRFQGLPQDRELAPFLDVLAGCLETPVEKYHSLAGRVPLGRELRLYVAAACPHCPQVVRQWAALARSGPHLRVRVVDGVLFPEEAQRDGVKAVPTLVVDADWRWSGQIPVGDVLRQLVDRDPAKLSAEALEGLLKEGQASRLATAMRQSGVIFPAFVDLVTHPKWPIRLGAMVVMEELIETEPALAATIIPVLMQRFADLDEQTQGDALYLMGETGNHATLAFVQALPLKGAGDELRQAAGEAATSIMARNPIDQGDMP
jgi:hypothetical protein